VRKVARRGKGALSGCSVFLPSLTADVSAGCGCLGRARVAVVQRLDLKLIKGLVPDDDVVQVAGETLIGVVVRPNYGQPRQTGEQVG